MTGERTVHGPTGVYRPCTTCRAPIVDPFPPAWEIEMVKEGPPQGPVKSFITPHRDDCTAAYADPQPGLALRLPGTTVASLTFTPPSVRSAAQGPAVPVDWTGWTDLGATAEGYAWSEAIDDIDAGQAVTFAGPGRLFVKPYVNSDLDADAVDLPVIDAILDAADTRRDEP